MLRWIPRKKIRIISLSVFLLVAVFLFGDGPWSLIAPDSQRRFYTLFAYVLVFHVGPVKVSLYHLGFVMIGFAMLALAFDLLHWVNSVAEVREMRVKQGLCGHCSYELQPFQKICPECGAKRPEEL